MEGRRVVGFLSDGEGAGASGCAAARAAMVRDQLVPAGITDPRVLAAMARVPREWFVPEDLRNLAYGDKPVSIGHGQTISQPALVARMLEAARLRATDHVLEVGSGSGYVAALLSLLVEHVAAVEIRAQLAQAARERLGALGFRNVIVQEGDGTRPAEPESLDAIIVSAGSRRGIPDPLKARLKLGGRLLIPVGDAVEQRLLLVTRQTRETYEQQDLGGVLFVPLR